MDSVCEQILFAVLNPVRIHFRIPVYIAFFPAGLRDLLYSTVYCSSVFTVDMIPPAPQFYLHKSCFHYKSAGKKIRCFTAFFTEFRDRFLQNIAFAALRDGFLRNIAFAALRDAFCKKHHLRHSGMTFCNYHFLPATLHFPRLPTTYCFLNSPGGIPTCLENCWLKWLCAS